MATEAPVTVKKEFPRTEVGGISMPQNFNRNQLACRLQSYKRGSRPYDQRKIQYADKYLPVFRKYLEYGIDAIMGSISTNQATVDAIKYAEDKLGTKK